MGLPERLGTLAIAVVVALLVHGLWPETADADRNAVAALIASVAAISATLFAHDYLLHSPTHVAVGAVLLAGGVVWGVVAILRAAPDVADSHVAYAAALVGVAGTMLGHSTGAAARRVVSVEQVADPVLEGEDRQ